MSTHENATVGQIKDWIIGRVAGRLGLPPEEIPTDQPVTRLGIDSTEAVVISGELQEWLGRPVPLTALWDHPTIGALAQHLGP